MLENCPKNVSTSIANGDNKRKVVRGKHQPTDPFEIYCKTIIRDIAHATRIMGCERFSLKDCYSGITPGEHSILNRCYYNNLN